MYRDIRRKEDDISKASTAAQAGHMERVHQGNCTFEQGLTFIEALNSLSRIANHLTSIAKVGHDEDARLQNESSIPGYLV
jgi:Na+/phosphate symporter